MPTQKALAQYIESFAQRIGDKLGHSPAGIARKLGTISYGEAEQFCLDIQRRHVLSLGEKPLKAIVLEQLAIWSARANAADYRAEGEIDGGTTAADPPGA
jgi:hypothetical protein